VNANGTVSEFSVKSSPDASLAESVMDAVKQWKFEPGKRNGEAVRFRMRVPVTFPKKK
jgi:protein TonB